MVNIDVPASAGAPPLNTQLLDMVKSLTGSVSYTTEYIATILCTSYAVTVDLDSNVACPGKVVTYTCTVRQAVILDWIVESFLPAGARVQFHSTDTIGSSLDCNSVASVRCEDFNFMATLTNIANPTVVMSTTVADMTSTLAFTATARLNRTVVQCRGTTAVGFPMTHRTLNVPGMFEVCSIVS